MKTLIVATDFSKEAENAVEYTGAAAKELNARVVLFNSFTIPVHTANSLLSVNSIEEIARQNDLLLEERAEKLASDYGIEAECESGLLLEVSDELEDLIKKHNADLVIMGMAAHTLAQDIFGNTTSAAIQKLKFPVLAVPDGVTYNGVNRILFACEVFRGVHKKVLDQIKELAALLKAEVEIFHVRNKVSGLAEDRDESSATENIKEGLEGVPNYYKYVDSEAVIEEIEKEIDRLQADLLIMIPYKYGFWNSLIHRSKTRIMASGTKIPLLSIPL